MPVNLVCPQCGHENKMVGVFCVKCGARMGCGGAQPNVKVRREPIQWMRGLYYVVRVTFIVALVGAIGLLMWPRADPPIEVNRPRALEFEQFLKKLDESVHQGATVPQSGLRQEAINNYLAFRIVETEGSGESAGTLMALYQFQISLTPSGIRVITVGGIGPLKLSFEITGQPVRRGNRFTIDVTSARIGHLPMPAQANGFVAGKIEQIVAGMQRERFVLDSMKSWRLGEGRIDIVVGR